MHYRLLFTLACFLLLFGCTKQEQDSLQGYVEADFTYIAAPFTGKLEKLHVLRGQKVQKNQPLFTLDQQPEQAEFEQAQKQLAQAEAAVKLAESRFNRIKRLFAKGAIDQDSLDAAEANYTGKKAEIAALKQEINKSAWALKQKTVKAPLDGSVYDTYFLKSELVPASNPVISILAPENIYITFFLPEGMLNQLHVNDRININCDNCKPYQAKISYISPRAEYTPPVIYSRENNNKLVYKIKAMPEQIDPSSLHPGQPIYVQLRAKG